jgi:hypothetical protein
MMRDPKVMELIEKFFPPEFLILLREPIGSPKFCEALGKLGFNALMDALIGLASGGALAGIKKVMGLGGEALKDAIEAAGKHVRKCTNCFVAGTLVVTACGWVPIEEVQVGDWVWARDEVTGEVRLCEVEETYRNESPVIVEVTAGGETLATTPGHPFWVLDHGWKDAGELEVGDRLVSLRGDSVVVEDIRRRPVPEAVYNFSVAGLHTYFVGQGGIWVHNNSGTGCGVRLRDPKTGRFTSDPDNPPSPYKYSDAQRRKDWAKLAADPESGLSDSERAQIWARGNRGPQRVNENGDLETMELSHEPIPLRDGGKVVVPRWPADHAAIDPYRRLKKP